MFIETNNFSKALFIALYENFDFKFFKFKSYVRHQTPDQSIQNFVKKEKSIKSIIFLLSGVSVINLNIPDLKEVYYIRDKFEFLYDRTLMIDGKSFENSKTKYYVCVKDPNAEYIEAYNNTLPDNIKVKPSTISFYGKVSRYMPDKNKFKLINSKLDIKDYRRLKNNQYIIWAGSRYFNRPQIINFLNKNSNIKIKCIDKYNLCEKKYIDILLENDGFCALSLDGSSVMCNRDTELGLSKIFNLKYTTFKYDASAADSIYIANNVDQYLQKIKEIKKDIEEENYSKLYIGEKYMNNLQIMRQQKFCNFFILEVLAMAANVDIKNLILNSSIINENLNSNLFLEIFRKFLKRQL